MKKLHKWYIMSLFPLLGAGIIIRQSGVLDFLTLDYMQQHAHYFYSIAQEQFFIALITFFGIFVCSVMFFLPITIILSVAAGFLFGVYIGTAVVLAAAAVGGTSIFLIIRYCIGGYVQRRYGSLLQKFNTEIEKYGSYYLLILQILPVTPTLLINVLSGISKISLWTYLWTTVVGILPGTLIYTLAGRQIHRLGAVHDIMSWHLIIMLCLIACIMIVPLIVRRYTLIKKISRS
jgi:uncharacterized membrane protein YdjX (TVP38/TMEM64 family)